MTDILRLFLGVVLLTITLTAYFLTIGVLFSNRVTKTQRIVNQTPWRSLGVGFINTLFFGVIAVVFFSIAGTSSGLVSGVLNIPALIITGFLILLLTFGLSGIVNELGVRLFPDYAVWKQTIFGSVILTFACALPFVGWFLLLPYIACLGVGATILGFFQRETTP